MNKQCIFGNHLKYGDVFIEKTPEGVIMCLECSKKYKDDTVYNIGGRKVGQYGIGYFKGYVDRRGKNPIIFKD